LNGGKAWVDGRTRVRRGARSAPKDGAAQRRRSRAQRGMRAQRAQSHPLRHSSGQVRPPGDEPRSRRRNLRAHSVIPRGPYMTRPVGSAGW
jgi:hypothetical protein